LHDDDRDDDHQYNHEATVAERQRRPDALQQPPGPDDGSRTEVGRRSEVGGHQSAGDERKW